MKSNKLLKMVLISGLALMSSIFLPVCGSNGNDPPNTSNDGTNTPNDNTNTPNDNTNTPNDNTNTPNDNTNTPNDNTNTPDDNTNTPDDGTAIMYPYICSNGAKAPGMTTMENREKCTGCDPGFDLTNEMCISIENPSMVCSYVGLPNNGETVTMGPTNNHGNQCETWEVTINRPRGSISFGRELRQYKFKGVDPSKSYRLTLAAVLGDDYRLSETISIIYQEMALTSPFSGTGLALIPAINKNEKSVTAISISEGNDEYHVSIQNIGYGEADVAITFTPE